MGKHKRAGYLFLEKLADHPPRHVHIYRDGTLVAKFDLKNHQVMSGKINTRILKALNELIKEKKL